MTVGERIRKLRMEHEWSQEELAKKMGYKGGKTTISKIETGDAELNQSKLVKFADILGTTPAYLMGWSDENGNDTSYYVSEETQEIAQEIASSRELKGLFDAARTASPEDLLTVQTMLLALKRKENHQE